MKNISIIDVDETLFGFNDALRDCALSHGYPFPTVEQCTHWNSVYDFIPKPEAIKLFDEVHDNQCQYAPFPDARGFLWFMRKHFYVIIASHRNSNSLMELKRWLKIYALPHDEVHVSFDKSELFSNPRARIVIDDRDETLRKGMDAGLVALGLRRPWNQNSKDRDYLLFGSLGEIKMYIETNVLWR